MRVKIVTLQRKKPLVAKSRGDRRVRWGLEEVPLAGQASLTSRSAPDHSVKSYLFFDKLPIICYFGNIGNRLGLGLESGFVARKHAHPSRSGFSDSRAAFPDAGAGLSM
jgi:hypothetical protein